jgi:ABC transporter substrate binding protein
MSEPMQRRNFITLIGGVAAWPLVARAQQAADRVRRIGVLMTFASDDPEAQPRLLAFAQGLQELGWTVGRNLRIDTRWIAGDTDRARKYAAELVALPSDVIVANSVGALGPLQQATRTVPIVFVNVPDPVGGGYIASLARPGGNATGFMQSEYKSALFRGGRRRPSRQRPGVRQAPKFGQRSPGRPLAWCARLHGRGTCCSARRTATRPPQALFGYRRALNCWASVSSAHLR